MRRPAAPNLRRRLVLWTVLLAIVTVWAALVVARREARRRWDRTLEVGVVLLARDALPREKAEALRAALPSLEAVLAEEYRRHTAGTLKPVSFVLAGLAQVPDAPPLLPDSDGLLARAGHAWELHRYLRRVHRDTGLRPALYDARIYVLIEPTRTREPRVVRGSGTMGGEVGLVRTQLDAGTIPLTLAAIGHELFHCLGATDKYDPEGHALDREGLAEPGLVPLYPQRWAEIMVGEVPLAPREGRLPDVVDEVRVGPVTAYEIGWR